MCARALAVALSLVTLGCGQQYGSSSPTTPSSATTANVRIVFMGATARRTDLPASAEACVNGVGATHTHPSWRNFASIPMQPVPPDRYEISFTDVPVNTRVSFRVNDQNACDQNPTGAVTQDVLANDVRLIRTPPHPATVTSRGSASRYLRAAPSVSNYSRQFIEGRHSELLTRRNYPPRKLVTATVTRQEHTPRIGSRA